MDRGIVEFLQRNGIDYQQFYDYVSQLPLETYERYDDGIDRYAIYGGRHDGVIPVADIIGMSNFAVQGSRNPLDNFSVFFDSNGDDYHSRANGLLEYSGDEIIQILSSSFRSEPICLYKMGDKCFVSSNGLHRVQLLRTHYLMDKMKGVDEDALRTKYAVPVQYQELDYLRTYINFIGSILWDQKFSIRNEYDQNYHMTGNSIVSVGNEEMVMANQELLAFMEQKLKQAKQENEYFRDILETMWTKCRWEKSGMFMRFINTYLPELSYMMSTDDYATFESSAEDYLSRGEAYGN